MQMLRFTRQTISFSKKMESLTRAVALHFCHYHFVRPHMSLRITPAMAAGVSDKLWPHEDWSRKRADEQ